MLARICDSKGKAALIPQCVLATGHHQPDPRPETCQHTIFAVLGHPSRVNITDRIVQIRFCQRVQKINLDHVGF